MVGRDPARAGGRAVVQPSRQLGLALAQQVLQVDLVALLLGEHQVQVDGQPRPVDLVTRRRLVTACLAGRSAMPRPAVQWAVATHGVPIASITLPSHECVLPQARNQVLAEWCARDVSAPGARCFGRITGLGKRQGCLVDVAVVALVGSQRLDIGLGCVPVKVAVFGRNVAERAIDVFGHGVGVAADVQLCAFLQPAP